MSGTSSSLAPAKPRWLFISIGVLLIVTAVDYWTGFELLFSTFYLVAIFIATWFVGWRAGLIISIVSVVCSLMGDLASGAAYSSALVPWWNVLISLCFYLATVLLLGKLRATQQQLEARVQERTSALRAEMTERERLEKALLATSEREQRRIGHDLHDSLCQQLTGTALAAQVLNGKLEARSLPEAADAENLVQMIEDSIDLSRSIARGLAPVELDTEGLMAALRELARYTTEHTPIECRLDLPQIVLLNDSHATTQLFRIAQEAVRNSVKHSQARQIVIGLTQNGSGLEMTVKDDGIGLPESLNGNPGMGLHIMRHRASMIGATVEALRLDHGTLITVRTSDLPDTNQS